MPGATGDEDNFAEPSMDDEGADDADYHEDQDDGPLVETFSKAATVCFDCAQEEPAVRCQACRGIEKRRR